MTNRLDALTVREYQSGGATKTAFTKIGAAFETKNGWMLTLDALPLPTMGERGLETKIILMPPKPKDGAAPAPAKQGNYRERSGAFDDDIDDEIPF